jgi:hypothetical protein
MSSPNSFAKSIRDTFNDDFPTLTPLTEALSGTTKPIPSSSSSSNSNSNYLFSITWQTWVIIILILALLGINIFIYLAKGTQATATIVDTVFGPILKFFGYSTLETTKQTVQTTATGTKAGVDVVANTTTGVINTVEQNGQNTSSSTPIPKMATGSQSGLPVQDQMQQGGGNAANVEEYQQDSLEKALTNASQNGNVQPDTSTSAIQSSKVTGKAGWCYIGEDRSIRTCGEIGVNDVCMSGDIFPSQEICMNPKLRA